ncbi:hypothetical protein [Candidatus Methanoprimaticola sp. MG2]|uniref:hypothetical protein n=1 Tax=Candidatus Methanoprimaticola sp. MG2 TaxID=3228838 RepID=UPI0039C67080
MKIDGFSPDVLKEISPQKIRLFLSSRGWVPSGKTATFDIFENPETSVMVTVPNSRDFIDYVRRVEEVVRDVSESDNLSIQRVLTGMTISSSSDTIEYHYSPENGEIGLIPVPDLISIIEAGNSINNYAYRDYCEFKPSYRSSNWKGKKILEDIRVGPTVAGSYIVQFIYPIMEDGPIRTTLFGTMIPDKPEMSYLCDKIESSLGAIIDAAERNKTNLDSDLEISYNFVNSVLDLRFDAAEIEVNRVKTISKNNDISKPYTLTKNIFPRIDVIEKNMRPEEMSVERDFVGKITVLKDPRDEINDESADVTITLVDIDGKSYNASFQLSGDDLNNAYNASKTRSNVQITGVLTGGRRKHIENPKGFKILS